MWNIMFIRCYFSVFTLFNDQLCNWQVIVQRKSISVVPLVSHHAVVSRTVASAFRLIPFDPLKIQPIAGGFPALVDADPLQSDNPDRRWDQISAAFIYTAPFVCDGGYESDGSFSAQ